MTDANSSMARAITSKINASNLITKAIILTTGVGNLVTGDTIPTIDDKSSIIEAIVMAINAEILMAVGTIPAISDSSLATKDTTLVAIVEATIPAVQLLNPNTNISNG